jgi:hypothetical protein
MAGVCQLHEAGWHAAYEKNKSKNVDDNNKIKCK